MLRLLRRVWYLCFFLDLLCWVVAHVVSTKAGTDPLATLVLMHGAVLLVCWIALAPRPRTSPAVLTWTPRTVPVEAHVYMLRQRLQFDQNTPDGQRHAMRYYVQLGQSPDTLSVMQRHVFEALTLAEQQQLTAQLQAARYALVPTEDQLHLH